MTSSTETKTPDGDRELSPTSAPAISAVDVEPHHHDALAPGHRLDEFEIVRVLGAGGFGIVYLALDQVLLRQVAIKEYFPTSLASRNRNAHVEARSRETGKTFDLGLESFINEARLLASFDHPSLVKVHRFWKQNGTAYMVMPYYPGQTLKSARRTISSPPDEKWLRALMDPLLGALEVLHAQDVFHRDIAPDNILLLPDGRPVILDFGSARRVISGRTQSLTAVLKPNFSPVEQYAEDAVMRQGAYTDIFALGGTVRFMMTGEAPTPAVMRAVRDTLPALSRGEPEQYANVSLNFLAAIDWMLALAPSDRPQTVAVLRRALDGEIAIPEPSARYVSMEEGAPAFGPTAALAKTRVVSREDASSPRTVSLTADRTRVAFGAAMPEPRPALHRSSRLARPSRRTLGVIGTLVLIGVVAFSYLNLVGAQSPRSNSQASVEPSIASREGEFREDQAPPATGEPAGVTATREGSKARVDSRSASSNDTVRPASAPRTATHRGLGEAPPMAPSVQPAAQSASLEACAKLGFFARSSCLSRACNSPALAGSAQCTVIRRIEESRQQRMER